MDQDIGSVEKAADADARSGDGRDDGHLLDIRDYIRAILGFWWLIAICVGVGGYLGVRDMHAFSRQSVAKMIVLPVSEGAEGSFPSGGLGFISALGGLALPGSGKSTKFDQMVYAMSSLEMARKLQSKHGLMQKIYAGAWDVEAKRWIRPKGDSFERQETINGYLNLPTWSPPTLENLAGFIKGMLKIEDVGGKGYMEIRFVHRDPEFALWMLKTVYEEAVGIVRERENRSQRILRKLIERRFLETPIAEFKVTLSELLASETRKELLASDELPYAVEIIEGPFISSEKTAPNTNRLVILKMIIGGAMASLFVLVWTLYRRE